MGARRLTHPTRWPGAHTPGRLPNEADAEAALDKLCDDATKVLGLTKRYV